MKILISDGKKLQNLCRGLYSKISCLYQSTRFLIFCSFRYLLYRINAFPIHVFYVLFLSSIGFWILKSLKPRTDNFTPRTLDLFFTSVSAATVSSMSAVEMEVFSNSQLIIMTILMFVGGEVFTSMIGLHLKKLKIIKSWKSEGIRVTSVDGDPSPPQPEPSDFLDQIELNVVNVVTVVPDIPRFDSQNDVLSSYNVNFHNPLIKYNSIKFLGVLVLGYLVVIQVLGIASVLIYLTPISSARDVLRRKSLNIFTFSIFTAVSTFASCGFVPTNENMMVFSKNSGLLLILMPQVLLGNTLFPPFLLFSIWVLGKKYKKAEANYLLKKTTEIGYLHLFPAMHSSYLVVTVLGFVFLGFILFCSMEWNSVALGGLNTYQKLVGALFQSVNARHTGETIVDLATLAPAILVFFAVMMYLPPYTSSVPIKKDQQQNQIDLQEKNEKIRCGENVILSQLSYLVVFIMLVCITERKQMREDPVNFNVLNITLEVISAYGNVGFTTGYSCDRQVKRDPTCVNKLYGFSGKWSDGGKVILIIVMFFGRLKKFNMNGGRPWKLL